MRPFQFLRRRLGEFRGNESGNYAVIFAISILPILGAVALAVDYSDIERERNAVQNSLDAAALATAKQFSNGVTGKQLTNYAEDFFEANLPDYIDPAKVDIQVSIKNEDIIDSSGDPVTVKTVRLDAELKYDSFIAQVVGHEQFDIGVASQVALGNITVEIAMVMDNSGSMGSRNKINLERSTARNLVDTIFNAASNSNKPNPVSFSLVPFSAMVNIGEDNKNADWMDTTGWSSIHHENLDWAHSYVTHNPFQPKGAGFREKIDGIWKWKSRYDIFDMVNTDWKGCVEMRPWPHNTDDTAATTGVSSDAAVVSVNENSSKSDRDRLFVPFFAPAEPNSKYAYESSGRGRWGRWGSGSGSTASFSNDWYNYGNDYVNDWQRPDPSDPTNLEQLYYDHPYGSPYNFGVIQSRQNLRQDWVWRYQAAEMDSRNNNHVSGDGTSFGPNDGCLTRPITPLTTSQSEIKAEIDRMYASGNTNIQQGIAWGWRTLSPSEPFTGGRDASDTSNRKYMIVLTDGNNTYNTSYTPNQTTYGAWGYGKHGRIDEGLTASDLAGTPYAGDKLDSYEKKMNAHTVQTCNNAKAAGVTVFTIAFEVSDGSSVKEMLEACSGSGVINGNVLMSGGIFYYDVSGSELETAMASIADQISSMRIMR